jgi:glucose/arabinose dehydrogenase
MNTLLSSKKIAILALAVVANGLAFSQNANLVLPRGFTAQVIAKVEGKPRHIAVTESGIIYTKLLRATNGKGIVQLLPQANGTYTVGKQFGNYDGTGIFVKGNTLFASSNEAVFSYPLNTVGDVQTTEATTLVTGLVNKRQHESKSIVVDGNNNIYVNIGAYSNACQEQDRTKGSKGMNPCPILNDAGGIWKFSSQQQNQSYAQGTRYATGLRNVVGLDWNTKTNKLYVMQHGRDQLHDLYPDLYTQQANADLPAETMYEIEAGDDCGWPYTYFDGAKKQIMLAPEYGGNGTTVATQKFKEPIAHFPAHMAPNGLLFYTGNQFPAKYKNGAFIAFHGSWNRAPLPQEGYYVVFIPFKNGKPSGEWEPFADGFAEKQVINSPRNAAHRPCGLAQDVDGSLLVTDDVQGFIYKISFKR